MTLVKGQTYRPMEQNGESKNMILSTDFDKSAKLIPCRKDSLQQMVSGQLDIHMGKYEPRHPKK